MPTRRWLLLPCLLLGIVVLTPRPHAQGPTATLHVVGDLPGGGATTRITDATRVGGVIYAVGGAVARATCPIGGPCSTTDTGILWRSDGSPLQALPDVVSTSFNPGVSASAITPDGAYIASTARDLITSTTPASSILRAVRVDTNALTNLNLSAFSPPLTFSAGAVAISTDGTILYGRATGRGIRFHADSQTSFLIPLICPVVNAQCPVTADNFNPVADRGSSADGSVAVGTSLNTTSLNARRKAYRYVHGSGVTAIPFLPGGTVNNSLAVSPDGDLVLVNGNTSGTPNEEVYLYRASTGGILRLGSPNSWWQPGGRLCTNNICAPLAVVGGMTFDGSVVAMSFAGQPFPGESAAYFHNAHGWFQFKSVLAANGVDFSAQGWGTGTAFQIHGISPDGTLVYGAGVHEGTVKGFVAEFGAGVLAAFNPKATAPANTSIVGVWTNDTSDPDGVEVFTAEGVYYSINGDGFERGLYTFDGSRVMLTTLFDTNGAGGNSGDNGLSIPLTVIGDTLDNDGEFAGQRIAGSPGSIVGGWVGGNPLEAHNSIVLAVAASKYFAVFNFPDGQESEAGTYTWNPVTHELVATVGGTVDPGNFVTPSPDWRSLHVLGDDGETFTVSRVVDPATIPVITNLQLSASGVAGQAFSYAVTATNTVTFSAAGLPGGLFINSSSGVISGTPGVGGQFAATIVAANGIGVSDIKPLTVTIAIPTPVGQNVVVEPEVPEGQGPVTLSFGEITTAGTTTVTVVDQSEVPAPGNVAVAGVIYEVTTTATYQGLITLCFSYAGIDFGTATPRLFHYENNEWVDITTSVDPSTQTICGATTTLSPFAVLASNVVRTGFYAPLNPTAGFLNTVKGGSTVPLKFDVLVNGVEQTTTAGLSMSQQAISCDGSAPEDLVEPAAVTGGAGLRYDAAAGHFIHNWKVPKTPGCYMVRMTTEQDGLALTARFKVK